MADEAILAAARATEAHALELETDVLGELQTMQASLNDARETAATIERIDTAAQDHADQMARELTRDAERAETLLADTASLDTAIDEMLAVIERERIGRSNAEPDEKREPLLVPAKPETHGASVESVKNVVLPPLSPQWLELPNDQRSLEEEMAMAVKDVAAERAPEADVERKPERRTSDEQHKAKE
jgi:hypothetical protein